LSAISTQVTFSSFPTYQVAILSRDFSQRDAKTTAAFAGVAVFGVMREVLGYEVRYDDFVGKGEGGELVVSTRKALPRYLARRAGSW